MISIKRSVLSLGLFSALLTNALAQGTPAAAPATPNSILLHCTSPYEDLVAPGIANNGKTIAELLVTADKEAEAVKKVLPAEAAEQFESVLKKIHQAADAGNGRAVALNGMIIYRILVDHLQADTLRIPKEVALLDYAGYQLQILAAADKPDWDALGKVTADATTWWIAIAKSKITNKAVRATVTSALRGANQAVQEKNLPMLKYAAQMDLDLVDVLEGLFPKTK